MDSVVPDVNSEEFQVGSGNDLFDGVMAEENNAGHKEGEDGNVR